MAKAIVRTFHGLSFGPLPNRPAQFHFKLDRNQHCFSDCQEAVASNSHNGQINGAQPNNTKSQPRPPKGER
jgi:hypothetical protein